MLLRTSAAPPRRGMILLVVLVLLTLFAIVVVTFVYLSESESPSGTNYVNAEIENRPEPDLLLGFVLNQLVFDTTHPSSALRTHSLIRNMYGGTLNTAYNGIGRLHSAAPPAAMDNYYLTN